MKCLLSILLVLGTLSVPARGQATAKGALSALAREHGPSVARQAVLIAGERGQNQPPAWRIVAHDPEFRGRFFEFVVRNGRVIEEHALAHDQTEGLPNAPLSQRRLRIDSRQAFALADEAAKKALIGFDSLDYELRNREYSNEPIWSVRLKDQNGTAVGELVIAADSGSVLRRRWFDGGNSPSVASRSRPPRTGGAATPVHGRAENGSGNEAGGIRGQALMVWDRTCDTIQHGHQIIRTNVKRATNGVRGWFGRSSSAQHEPNWENGTYDQWE